MGNSSVGNACRELPGGARQWRYVYELAPELLSEKQCGFSRRNRVSAVIGVKWAMSSG